MNGDTGSYEILTAALGLLTATHADHRMAVPVTMDYLAGVPTDRSQMLNLVAGMTALASLLIQMLAEETGVARGDPGGVGATGPAVLLWRGLGTSAMCNCRYTFAVGAYPLAAGRDAPVVWVAA